MKKASRNKESFIKHYYKSCKYSLEGLKDTFKTERSFHLWFICFLGSILFAIVLQFTLRDYLLVMIIFSLILIVELLNTAIEHTVDLVTKEIHPLAKKAKDCGSAASFVITFLGILLGILILLPYWGIV